MRIARPRRTEVDFKRKRRPPPQATKLLTYSLLSGIVFMVLLAVVFVPQLLVDQPPVATPVVMEFAIDIPSNQTRLMVVSVGALVDLSKLRANFTRGNTTLGSMGPPLGPGDAVFSFHDANNTGVLGPGDYFLVAPETTGSYRVSIEQLDERAPFLVGTHVWTGKPTA